MTDEGKFAFKSPISAGGVRLKRNVEKATEKDPKMKEIAAKLPLKSWDRLHDIMSGKVDYDHG